ncbi:MAG TPA: hypothetical protein VG713_21845, partial [Pirellulales bacterium]|nr:hypothetical protein [Pirellulales bacterium]
MTWTKCSWLVVGLIGSLLVACSTAAAADAPDALPLSRVILYNSGVGFFEHAAEIDGNQRIELKFNVDDVNDLLKSMVLRDLDGGTISSVTYGSRDPITTTLKTFAIDLTDNPTLADLLDQVRGERVSIQALGTDAISGVILGVEKRTEKAGDEAIEVEYLNLLTEAGLRSFSLASVGSVRLLNDALDRELRQALTILAMGHSTDKKSVAFDFQGKGKRRVRVGYVQKSPIWKTSYRLVVGEKNSAMLQGWAIVENTGEQDWNKVNLTLVSGRPISFVMNLYEPLYVQRPLVEPELFASLRPQVYEQNLRDRSLGRRRADKAENAATAVPAAPMAEARAAGLGGAASDQFGYLGLDQGVASAASAGELGELFQYAIDNPVTLPRQQSALLPIVQDTVAAEKVSIYNPAVQAKHPLGGLR